MDGRRDAGLGQAHQSQIISLEETGDPGQQVVVMRVLEDGIECKSRKRSIGQRKKNLGDRRSRSFAAVRGTDRGKHEDEEEENDEERGDPHRLAYIEGAIVLGVPADEESDSRRKCPEQKPRPRFEADEHYRCEINRKDVAKKKNLVVAAAGEQQRGRDTSCPRVTG